MPGKGDLRFSDPGEGVSVFQEDESTLRIEERFDKSSATFTALRIHKLSGGQVVVTYPDGRVAWAGVSARALCSMLLVKKPERK